MSYYRISYTREYESGLNEQRIFKYIDNYVLYDMETVDELVYEARNHDRGIAYSPLDVDIQDYSTITDRDTAAAYIKQHRAVYEYIGYDTGTIDRILCVEITTIDGRDRATAALYDHPKHGLIWLEMYKPH